MAFVKGSELKFGLEIECYIPINNYTHGNITWRKKSFDLEGTNGWKIGTDSSLASRMGYVACEICSPPLAGISGLAQVVTVLDYLNKIGTETNQSCGVHIHVDASQLNLENFNGLRQSFIKYQSLFFATNGEQARQRMSATWCKPATMRSAHDRYRALNCTNYHRHPDKDTVEFRLFKATTNPETIFTWLYMCVGLVSRATKETTSILVPRDRSNVSKCIELFVKQTFGKKEFQIDPEYSPSNDEDRLDEIIRTQVPISNIF